MLNYMYVHILKRDHLLGPVTEILMTGPETLQFIFVDMTWVVLSATGK